MASTIIEEYLAKIGFVTDKNGFNEVQNQLKQVQNQLNGLNFANFLTGMAKVMTALVGFELAAAAALAAFTKQVVSADMQTQIFARRLMTTTENARSLKNVMSAMGLQSLEDLRDVALNPTLRKQFLGLRQYASGLEPGANVQAGLGNFRDVGYQIQKINVLLSYLSQYVVGYLGKILEGPLKHMSDTLEYWATKGKNQINQWAEKIAYYLAFIQRFGSALWGIGVDIFRILKQLKVDHLLLAIIYAVMAAVYTLRDILDWISGHTEKPIKTAKDGLDYAIGVKKTDVEKAHGGQLGVLFGYGKKHGFGSLFTDPWIHAAKSFGLMKSSNDGSSMGLDPATQKVFLAQAALESGYGKSSLARKYNNYFGVKGTGPAGSVMMPTLEYWGGRYHKTMAKFRAYNNPAESWADHLKLLQNPRYKGVWQANTFEEKAHALQKAGYATDGHYAEKLIHTGNIIININGAKDPRAVAKEVHGALSTRTLQGVGA